MEDKSGRESKKRLWDTGRYLVGCLLLLCMAGKSYAQGDDLAWAFNNGAKVQQWQKDNMWKEGETNSKYPRMFISSANNIKPSTYWLQDASYLRLKNLQIGYTIPHLIHTS